MPCRRTLPTLPLALAAVAWSAVGCRATDAPPPGGDGAAPLAVTGEHAAPADGSAAPDAPRVGDGPRAAATDRGADLAAVQARIDRIDQRLLELQVAINQLDAASLDRTECERAWEELDRRRAALRRAVHQVGAAATSDRGERRRALGADLDALEVDVEHALDEVGMRLTRG